MNISRPTERFMTLPFTREKASEPNSSRENRLLGIGWVPNTIRNHFIAWLGEFVGTFMFLFFAFSAAQVANEGARHVETQDESITQAPNTSVLLYIALSFGFSLAVNVWVFFRISGGLFNPAVTLGLCLIGAVPWIRGAIVFTAQLCGAMASAAIVGVLFPGALNVRTTLGPGTSVIQGLLIEMLLTLQLVFTIFMLAAEKHKGTFLAPIGIGLSLFIAELTGVYFTGGSLNPARSFGPDVVNHNFDSYHWIYWLGPALGALLAVLFYRLIKTLEYETANPGQDFDDKENEVFSVDENPSSAAEVRRPNVNVGESEYMVDERGIHRWTRVRTDSSLLAKLGGAAQSPTGYDGTGQVSEGRGDAHRPVTAGSLNRRRRSGGPQQAEDAVKPDDVDLERGHIMDRPRAVEHREPFA